MRIFHQTCGFHKMNRAHIFVLIFSKKILRYVLRRNKECLSNGTNIAQHLIEMTKKTHIFVHISKTLLTAYLFSRNLIARTISFFGFNNVNIFVWFISRKLLSLLIFPFQVGRKLLKIFSYI